MGVQVGLNDRRYSRARWPSRQNLFKLQALSNGQIVDLCEPRPKGAEFHNMLHHNAIDSTMNGDVGLTRIEPR